MTKSTTRRFLCCLLALCCLLGSLTAFSLAAGTGFVLFGAPLAGFIYRDVEVGEYVRILGFVAPFMYLESMVDGVLKGLGEQLATFYYSLADSIFSCCQLAAAAALRHGGIPRHHDHLQPVHLHVKPDPHAALHTKTAP